MTPMRWAREAIVQSPEYLGSHNTLGVIYMRRGDLAQSKRSLSYLLEREPANARAMSNLAQVFARQGRDVESAALLRRLAQIEPVGPFHYFNLGRAAMEQQNFKLARDIVRQRSRACRLQRGVSLLARRCQFQAGRH